MEIISRQQGNPQGNADRTATGSLTPRERQIVCYLCCGFKESAVALSLGISPSTVHSHIASAHRKLGVASRPRLVATVVAIGIIPLEELREMLTQTGDC